MGLLFLAGPAHSYTKPLLQPAMFIDSLSLVDFFLAANPPDFLSLARLSLHYTRSSLLHNHGDTPLTDFCPITDLPPGPDPMDFLPLTHPAPTPLSPSTLAPRAYSQASFLQSMKRTFDPHPSPNPPPLTPGKYIQPRPLPCRGLHPLDGLLPNH